MIANQAARNVAFLCGYDPQFVRQDANRFMPLDVMRELEQEGVIERAL